MAKKVNKEIKMNQESTIVQDFFKVKQSTNSVIDSELNRIWGYLKLKEEKEKEQKNLDIEIDKIKKDIEVFKIKCKEDIDKSKLELDLSDIFSKIQDNLFSSELFIENIALETAKRLSSNNSIKVTIGDKILREVRFEFGYATKGSIVFFKKAFSNVYWYLPNEISLATNTGFVSLKDSFWMVVGENSEDSI